MVSSSRYKPAQHVAQIFDSELAPHASLRAFVQATSFGAADSPEQLLLIARCDRLDRYIDSLLEESIDVETLVASGRMILLDTHELLTRGQRPGEFDPLVFTNAIGKQIEPLLAAGQRLRVYSEMADYLCELGRHNEAAQLEKLCAHLTSQFQVSILCLFERDHLAGASTELLLGCHMLVIDGDEELSEVLSTGGAPACHLFSAR